MKLTTKDILYRKMKRTEDLIIEAHRVLRNREARWRQIRDEMVARDLWNDWCDFNDFSSEYDASDLGA